MSGALETALGFLALAAVIACIWFVERVNDRYFDWLKSKMSYRTFLALALTGFLLSAAIIVASVWPLLQMRTVKP